MGTPGLWQRWGEWRKYHADGVKGGEALSREIARVVYESGIKSPVTSKRGFDARLRYLDSPAGRAELRDQGITPRALRSWLTGKATPSRASREKVDSAYWTRRADNLLKSGQLKRLLNNDGMGRRIEIYPVDQSGVDSKYRRDLQTRSIQGRYIWDDLVDAWESGDDSTMDEVWEDIINDLDSDYAAYSYVGSVSIGV